MTHSLLLMLAFLAADVGQFETGEYSGTETQIVKQLTLDINSRWFGEEYEYILWDRSRVDILTIEHAIEVDWSSKQAEAIGQSLWYASQTNRKPGIILLVKDFEREFKNIYRCKIACQPYGIPIWLVKVQDGNGIER